MENGFDYETGKLIVNAGTVRYDLDIRRPISQILGDSGTGKTWLVNYMQNDRRSGVFNGISDFGNVYTITETGDFDSIVGLTRSLILVDRGDLILTDDLVRCIMLDRGNDYLVFSRRSIPLHISPNYYGEFKRNESGVIILEYMYSVMGWY